MLKIWQRKERRACGQSTEALVWRLRVFFISGLEAAPLSGPTVKNFMQTLERGGSPLHFLII